MRIVTLCATQRGYRFVKRLAELAPEHELVVFSFAEDPWEPRYLDDIRELTLANGGEFHEAKNVGGPKWRHFWVSTPVDLMFAVSWRYLIPASIYRRARIGTFVFHDSLLPEYRGFSPTVWAMINGEDHTGVSLFEIADGVDEGDIVAQKKVPIRPDDVIADVLERVTESYLDLLEENLSDLLDDTAVRRPQDHASATYTCKRVPNDNGINWSASTNDIHNLIRAVSQPYPGAFTYLFGQKLLVWSASRVPKMPTYVGRVPGRVVAVHHGVGTVVLTGDSAIQLNQVQLPGGDIVCAAEVLNSLSQTLGY